MIKTFRLLNKLPTKSLWTYTHYQVLEILLRTLLCLSFISPVRVCFFNWQRKIFCFFYLRLDKQSFSCILSGILEMPTWRNGRRAAFRSQSVYAGEGSSPFVGTNYPLPFNFLFHSWNAPFLCIILVSSMAFSINSNSFTLEISGNW